MPAKKQNRVSRTRRQAVRQRPPSQPRVVDEGSDEFAEAAPATSFAATAPPRTSSAQSTARRVRPTRVPAQIVVANYDFLRHDLRLLGLLAPTLIVVMVVLSFVIH